MKKKEEKQHLIYVAYDRQTTRYIAYNIETSFYGFGYSVQAAEDDYRSKYYNSIEIEEDATSSDYQ
jgi:hypothetical protein